MTSVGGNKGKKGKKSNIKSKVVSKSFNIDFAVINKFGLVKVSPPIAAEDLDHKISELTERKNLFTKEGEETLAKQR